MKPLEIAIIEDEPNYQAHLKQIISDAPDLVCRRSYSNAKSAIKGLKNNPMDIVIVDINLPPGKPGTYCIQKLRKAYKSNPRIKTKFIVLTFKDEDEEVFNALKSGAMGYMLKSSSPSEILEAIRSINRGEAPMSPAISRKVVSFFHSPIDISLSDREQEIIGLLADAVPLKNIADNLFITIETVKSHCSNIYKKLHAVNKVDAINKYFGRIRFPFR
ncbi:MAG: response regulator transcription factor [Bacteroidia bacterium]|nr:response regulator transcription factor [Bacteroidia bacterium]